MEAVEDHNTLLRNDQKHRWFRLSVNNDQYEEMMLHNDIISHLEREQEGIVMWEFTRIIGHQGPLTATDPDYKGSNYGIQVEWENG